MTTDRSAEEGHEQRLLRYANDPDDERTSRSSAEPRHDVEKPRPRLLFFFEGTDGHARRVDGYLAQVLQRRRNHESFLIHRIDIRERSELAERLRVDRTPAICVIEGRRVAARVHKPRSAKQLRKILAPWLR